MALRRAWWLLVALSLAGCSGYASVTTTTEYDSAALQSMNYWTGIGIAVFFVCLAAVLIALIVTECVKEIDRRRAEREYYRLKKAGS